MHEKKTIQLDDIKSFVRSDRNSRLNAIVPVLVTLISGLMIIISISPVYLRELNPFTLFLLSIAAALPIWALNQLYWWHIGRRVSSEVSARVVMILQVSGRERKALSFAIYQLMKAIDIVRFIPSKSIANLVTIATIYIGVVANYFTNGTPAQLYGYILLPGFLVWLIGLLFVRRACRKIDIEPLQEAWQQLKANDDLIAHIDALFERTLDLVRGSVFFARPKPADRETDRESSQSEQGG